MAEQFLEEIYKYAQIVTALEDISKYARIRDNEKIMEIFDSISNILNESCQEFISINKEKGNKIYENLLKLSSTKDVLSIADILDIDVIPAIYECIKELGTIDVDDESVRLISSESGFLTVQNKTTGLYYHSRKNPMTEAYEYVSHIFSPQYNEYIIYGLGLGYYAYRLYYISQGSVKITVYEHNNSMIEYARSYGVLSWIPENTINIISDFEDENFIKAADSSAFGVLYHLPSVQNIASPIIRSTVMEHIVMQNSFVSQKELRRLNYWRNVTTEIPDATTIPADMIKQDVAIIAAGPSLDQNIELLKKFKTSHTLIAVGTVYKKLLNLNIIPDFVVIMDPFNYTFKQTESLTGNRTTLVINSYCYWQIAATFDGPKYIINNAEAFDQAEYAHSLSYPSHTWPNWGGTVTATAIELAIQYSAKNIVLFGVDLAYPGGISHADNTDLQHIEDTSSMLDIKSVDGSFVKADPLFIIYRKQIEQRIKQTPDIRYYNTSKTGAFIEGTIAYT